MYYVTLHGIDSVTERRVGWGERGCGHSGKGTVPPYTSSIKSRRGEKLGLQARLLYKWVCSCSWAYWHIANIDVEHLLSVNPAMRQGSSQGYAGWG